MPYKIVKRAGKRPWKILDAKGKVVGSSTTKKSAESSKRARLAGSHGWRGTRQ